MNSDWFGLVAVLAVYFVLISVVWYSRLSDRLKALLTLAILVRLVGALGRYGMLTILYRGRGDARVYYRVGLGYAEQIWQLDLSFLVERAQAGDVWETWFVHFISSLVLSVIGPTMLGEYFAFSLFPLLGLAAFVVAFHRAYPALPVAGYLVWIAFFPSLWFWPSSIGKEAITLMGMGLAAAGFVGRRGRIHWPLLALGVVFVFAIRAQVAAVLVLSLVLAQFLSFRGRWTVARTVQAVLILGVGLGAIAFFLRQSGIESLNAAGVTSYMATDSARDLGGGSGITPPPVAIHGIPMAMVNILCRPFPWEAGNPQMLVSGLEVMLLWLIIWYRRHNLLCALRAWRSDRLIRAAMVFVLVYTVALGMMMSNLGIIARQRIFIFPFIFILLEAVPALARRPRARPSVHRPARVAAAGVAG